MKSLELELGRLLTRTMGLNHKAVEHKDLLSAVKSRMQATRVATRTVYLGHLRASRQERQALVESVRLPHSDFFEHAEPLLALQRWVSSHWLARPSKRPLRILSVPCATGEEPYSIAITLLERGLLPTQFHIDAIDINDRALRIAAAAVYPASALDQVCEGVRERYFARELSGFRLASPVRTQVSFLKVDLLGSSPLAEGYDIIFGRSLMMYFVPAAQNRILLRLEKLLKPAGLFMTGPQQARGRAGISVPVWSDDLFNARSQHSRNPKTTDESGSLTRLREAIALLEARHFRAAAAICIGVLQQHHACAQAVCLLGRIAHSEGRHAEAREYFRRALYLQPRLRQAQERLRECEKETRKGSPLPR